MFYVIYKIAVDMELYKINIIISHRKLCFLYIVYEWIKVASLINLAHHKSNVFAVQIQVCNLNKCI